MVIHGIHNPLTTATFLRPQTPLTGESVRQTKSRVGSESTVFTRTELAGVDVGELLRKIHELPELNETVLKEAVARFESGQLLAHEAGQLTSASRLQDFVY